MTDKKKKSNYRSGNSRRPYYGARKKAITSKAGSQSNSSGCELRFHMHDSVHRKKAESYGKMKEAIVLRIQKTFNNGCDLAECM